jgi:hypothetical protein
MRQMSDRRLAPSAFVMRGTTKEMTVLLREVRRKESETGQQWRKL